MDQWRNKNTFYLLFKENTKLLKVPQHSVIVTIALYEI